MSEKEVTHDSVTPPYYYYQSPHKPTDTVIVIRETSFQINDILNPYRFEVMRGYIRDAVDQQQAFVKMNKNYQELRNELEQKDALMQESDALIEAYRSNEAADVTQFKEEMFHQLHAQCDKITKLNTKVRELTGDNATLEADLMATQCKEREAIINNSRLQMEVDRLNKELACHRGSSGAYNVRLDDLQATLHEKISLNTMLQEQLQHLTKTLEEQNEMISVATKQLNTIGRRYATKLSQISTQIETMSYKLQHTDDQTPMQDIPQVFVSYKDKDQLMDCVKSFANANHIPNLENLENAVEMTISRLQTLVAQLITQTDNRVMLEQQIQHLNVQSVKKEAVERWSQQHTLWLSDFHHSNLEEMYHIIKNFDDNNSINTSQRSLIEFGSKKSNLLAIVPSANSSNSNEWADDDVQDVETFQRMLFGSSISDVFLLEGVRRLSLENHHKISLYSLYSQFKKHLALMENLQFSNILQQQSEQINILEDHKKRLNCTLDAKCENLKNLESRASSLSNQCLYLEQGISEAAKSHNKIQKKCEELQIHQKETMRREQEANIQIEKQNNILRELEDHREALVSRLQLLQRNFNQQGADMELLRKEASSLIENVHVLQTEKGSLQRTIESLELEINNAHLERQKIDNVITKWLKCLHFIDDHFAQSIQRLESGLQAITGDFAIKDVMPDQDGQGISPSSTQTDSSLQAEGADETVKKGEFTRASQSISNKVAQIDSMMYFVEECRRLLAERDLKIYQLNEAEHIQMIQLQELECRFIHSEDRIKVLQEEVENQQQKLSEQNKELNDSKDREGALRRDLERIWEHFHHIDTEVQCVKNDTYTWQKVPGSHFSRSHSAGVNERRHHIKKQENHQILKEISANPPNRKMSKEDNKIVVQRDELSAKWQR